MRFDRDLAREVLESRDRDTAMFFAGREHEISTFDRALREAAKSRQAVFRIYQGAPGCGKTSLAARLAEIHSEEVLFVHLKGSRLNDADALSELVRRAAIKRGAAFSRMATALAECVVARFNLEPIADVTSDLMKEFRGSGGKLVFHLDEAHARVSRMEELLLDLHTDGFDEAPCVVLLTGLGHTADRLANIDGLSRLASDAVIDMGTMAEDECAESTRRMLDALEVSRNRSEVEALSRLTGELAHGWPQHLHCAQTALCDELVRKKGVLRSVNEDRVRSASEKMRYTYYQERVRRHPVLGFDEVLTKRMIVDITKARFPRHGRARLEELCDTAVEMAGLSGKSRFGERPGEAFSTALIEKGILSGASGTWEAAIPSMVKWAENTIG